VPCDRESQSSLSLPRRFFILGIPDTPTLSSLADSLLPARYTLLRTPASECLQPQSLHQLEFAGAAGENPTEYLEDVEAYAARLVPRVVPEPDDNTLHSSIQTRLAPRARVMDGAEFFILLPMFEFCTMVFSFALISRPLGTLCLLRLRLLPSALSSSSTSTLVSFSRLSWHLQRLQPPGSSPTLLPPRRARTVPPGPRGSPGADGDRGSPGKPSERGPPCRQARPPRRPRKPWRPWSRRSPWSSWCRRRDRPKRSSWSALVPGYAWHLCHLDWSRRPHRPFYRHL